MTLRSIALTCLFFSVLAGCETTPRVPAPVRVDVGDALIELDNGILAVAYDKVAGTLSAKHHKWHEALLTDAKLAAKPGQASVVDVSDVDGTGKAIRIEYDDGRRDLVSVWVGSPTAYLRMQNTSSPSTAKTQPAKYAIDLGPGPYVGYDSGANKFALSSSYTMTALLEPGQWRLIGFRKVENPPMLLGATGQTAHRFTGVEDQRWNSNHDALSGTCTVKAGEPYELRILAAAWLRGKVKLVADDRDVVVTSSIHRSGPFNRVKIESKADCQVQWSVVFK